ncbi:MAG: ComF family protein, partial [Pseudomonadota bacterium]
APPWCQACGLPFTFEDETSPLCAACAAPDRYEENLTGKGRLDMVRAAIAYDETIAGAILRLKYADRLDGVQALSRLMVTAGADLFDGDAVLVPVPLHKGRLMERRYNQAGVLAQAIGQQTGLPVYHQALVRRRATAPQKGGSRTARARNVNGAFEAVGAGSLADRHVVLVDDVLTTGATLIACAKALRNAGITSVSALCLSRVVKTQDPILYGLEG